MLVAEVIHKANLRAKALSIIRHRGLYEPMHFGLNSGSLRMHGMIAVQIAFSVRLQQPFPINYARARGQEPKMPSDDFEVRPNDSNRLPRNISQTEGKPHEHSALLRASGEGGD